MKRAIILALLFTGIWINGFARDGKSNFNYKRSYAVFGGSFNAFFLAPEISFKVKPKDALGYKGNAGLLFYEGIGYYLDFNPCFTFFNSKNAEHSINIPLGYLHHNTSNANDITTSLFYTGLTYELIIYKFKLELGGVYSGEFDWNVIPIIKVGIAGRFN